MIDKELLIKVLQDAVCCCPEYGDPWEAIDEIDTIIENLKKGHYESKRKDSR